MVRQCSVLFLFAVLIVSVLSLFTLHFALCSLFHVDSFDELFDSSHKPHFVFFVVDSCAAVDRPLRRSTSFAPIVSVGPQQHYSSFAMIAQFLSMVDVIFAALPLLHGKYSSLERFVQTMCACMCKEVASGDADLKPLPAIRWIQAAFVPDFVLPWLDKPSANSQITPSDVRVACVHVPRDELSAVNQFVRCILFPSLSDGAYC